MHHGDAMPYSHLMLQAQMDPEKQLVVDGKIQAGVWVFFDQGFNGLELCIAPEDDELQRSDPPIIGSTGRTLNSEMTRPRSQVRVWDVTDDRLFLSMQEKVKEMPKACGSMSMS